MRSGFLIPQPVSSLTRLDGVRGIMMLGDIIRLDRIENDRVSSSCRRHGRGAEYERCYTCAAPESIISDIEGLIAEAIDSTLIENRIIQPQISVPSPNDPLSEDEAATYLRILPESVRYFALRTGELAYCNFGKGRRTYLRKDLDEFLEKRREPSIDEKVKTRPRRKGVEK